MSYSFFRASDFKEKIIKPGAVRIQLQQVSPMSVRQELTRVQNKSEKRIESEGWSALQETPCICCSQATWRPQLGFPRISLPEGRQIIIPITDLLPSTLKIKYETGEGMISQDTVQWELARKVPIKLEIPEKEYVILLHRLQRLGMITFLPKDKVHIINRLKCVSKKDGRQRLIFDGRPVNLILKEPETTTLPNFALVEDWKVSQDECIRFAKIDIDNYYHRIGIPEWLQPLLGLPPVSAQSFGVEGDRL